MSRLWGMAEIIAATGGRPVGEMPESVSGISIDTRTLAKGDAFFAIAGDRFDGHDFVSEAMKAGAALAVVSEKRLVALGRLRIPLLVVSDVLAALENLGIAARSRSRAKMIAITGSVGKTSTKEMLRAALGNVGKTHASPASFNNHWGVPLTLARMPADTQFGVFELGMNHPGEIRQLVKLVRPHVALVTAIAPAHLGAFESVEGIARAKAEIFEGLELKGTALIPRDSKYYKLLDELARTAGVEDVRSFGTKRGADFRLVETALLPDGSRSRLSIEREPVDLLLSQAGEHAVMNALAALGAAHIVGANLSDCARALARVRAGSGRGERFAVPLDGGKVTVIDESYNANPASMEAALRMLGAVRPEGYGRRIAALGDMLELGDASPRLHKALRQHVIDSECDLVYLGGPEMATLAEILDPRLLVGHYKDAEALADDIISILRPDDVVMIKASNGLKFSIIVQKIKAVGSASKAEVP